MWEMVSGEIFEDTADTIVKIQQGFLTGYVTINATYTVRLLKKCILCTWLLPSNGI